MLNKIQRKSEGTFANEFPNKVGFGKRAVLVEGHIELRLYCRNKKGGVGKGIVFLVSPC